MRGGGRGEGVLQHISACNDLHLHSSFSFTSVLAASLSLCQSHILSNKRRSQQHVFHFTLYSNFHQSVLFLSLLTTFNFTIFKLYSNFNLSNLISNKKETQLFGLESIYSQQKQCIFATGMYENKTASCTSRGPSMPH
jgi:hypothetical protein